VSFILTGDQFYFYMNGSAALFINERNNFLWSFFMISSNSLLLSNKIFLKKVTVFSPLEINSVDCAFLSLLL
jgi:hypothetical protein